MSEPAVEELASAVVVEEELSELVAEERASALAVAVVHSELLLVAGIE